MAAHTGGPPFSVTGSKSRYHHYDIQFHSRAVAPVTPSSLTPISETFAPPVFKPIRSQTCCARIVYRIQALWHLIKNIFKFFRTFTPQFAEANAYAHLLLGGRETQLPSVLNSQICRAFCKFLIGERNIPPQLISTLSQTADWMEVLEKTSGMVLFPGKRHQLLSSLAQTISTRIKSLREGEFCVIPGGLMGMNALYRVTKRGSRYEWEFLSRDPQLPHGEEIGFIGREKIRIGTLFTNLTEEEVSNPRWLHALLNVQMTRSDTYALFRLFEGFKGRMIDPGPSRKKFHKAQTDARVGNLWSLIEEVAYKGNKAQGKLRRQIFALYRYSEELSALPKIPASAKEVTLEASKRIRQKMLSMVEKDQLAKEEAERLNAQINRVEEMVQEEGRQELLTSSVPYHAMGLFLLPRLNTVAISTLAKPLTEIERKEDEGKGEAETKIAVYKSSGKVFKKIVLPELGALSPADLIGTIEVAIKEIEGEKDPLAMQYKLIDLCAAIPFDNLTIRVKDKHDIEKTVANPKEVWALCSPEERIRASALFTRLGTLLFEKAKAGNALYPNRLFALNKYFSLVQHLAILNRSITGIQVYYQNWLGSHYGDRFLSYSVNAIFNRDDNWFYDYGARSPYRDRWPIDSCLFELNSFKDLRSHVHIENSETLYFDKLAAGRVPRCAQSEHLVQLNTCLLQFLENNHESSAFNAHKLGQWGPRFQDKRLMGVVHGTRVAKDSGTYGAVTQEAMVDDPMGVLKDALANWLRHSPSEKWREQVAGKKIEELSTKQMTDVLLTLDKHTVIWNILGLIEEQPSVLFHPDIFNLVEFFLLNKNYVTIALEADDKLQERIKEFFDKNIAKLLAHKDFQKAFSLVHLSQGMRVSVTALHSLKDYLPLIHEWINEARQPSSPNHPYLHALLTEALLSFQNCETLTEEQLLQMAIYGFALDVAEPHPDLWDPVQHDQVKRVMKRWQPQLIELFKNKDFLHAVMEHIFRLHGKRMPVGEWVGGYPEYRLRGHRIDFKDGIYEDPDGDGFSDQYLPIPILRDPTFVKAFPNILTTRPKITKYEISSGKAYVFRDEKGNEIRIEKSGQQIRCFRKHPQRDEWLLAIMPPPDLLDKLPTPIGCLTFYQSCNRPQEWFAYTDACEPHYGLLLERVVRDEDSNTTNRDQIHQFRLAHVDDLRIMGRRKGYQVAVPTIETDPALVPLFSFEHPSHVTLWARNGRIEYIELARHGLCFASVNGQWHCETSSFAGYILNLHPTSSQLGGLASGLFLEHPTQVSKVLLPRFKGKYSPYPQFNFGSTEFHGRLGQIKMAFKLLNQFVINPAPPPGSLWFQDKESVAGFWAFDSQRGILSSHEENGCLWFDLLCHSMMSLQRPTCSSYRGIRKALFELSKLSFKDFSDEQLMQWIWQLEQVVKEGKNNDITASALQCLTLLHAKVPSRLQHAFKSAIARVSILYFSAGKHMDISVSLNTDQIALTLECLDLFYPEEAVHVRRITEGEFKELAVTPKRKKFFDIVLKRSALDATISQTILSEIQDRNVSLFAAYLNSELFLNNDFHQVCKSFQKFYEAARKGKVEIVNFEKMHLTAKLLLTSSDAARDFLELLFELQEEFPSLALPPFPTIEFATVNWQDSEEVKTRKETQNARSEKEFVEFMNRVLIVVNTALGQRKTVAALSVEEEEFKETHAVTLVVPASKPKLRPTVDRIVALERIIATALRDSLSTPMVCQPEDALFNEKELVSFFTISESESKEIALDFSEERAKEEEPATKLFVDELQSEMTSLSRQKEQRIALINEETAAAIASSLKEKIQKLEAQGEKIAAEIMAQINAHKGSLPVGAGYRYTLTWPEVFNAVRHSNLEMVLTQAGIAGVDADLIKKRMSDFLRVATKRKHAEYCLGELKSMIDEDILKVSGDKLYEMLARPRAYDPLKFPQILILEEVLGFYIRKRQMDIACAFVTDPSSVRCALTGDGKTSVILTLAGLLKPSKRNLVTLKFLDPLFAENFAQLNRVILGAFNRQVMPLLFSMKQSLVLRRRLEDHELIETEKKEKEEKSKEEPRRVVTEIEESYFKRLYQSSLEVMAQQGALVSNKRSQPLIQAKFISILYKLSIVSEEEIVKDQYDIEWEHLHWIAKNLLLYKSSQEQVLDEHDKFCNPRDELHLRIGGTDPVPSFMARTILEIMEEFRKCEELGLSTNTHAELTSEQRDKIRFVVAERMAKVWSERNPKLDPKSLSAYFKGDSEDVLKGLEENAFLEQCDAIALTKDMLTIFLKLTLSKKGNAKYILSEDGVSVIPCSHVDKPREGSEFEDIRERMPYLIQYVYYHGVPVVPFTRWVKELVRSAEEERQKLSLSTIDDTSFSKLFRTYFPDQQLSKMTHPDRVAKLHESHRKNPMIVKKFLEILLADLRVSKRKVTIDAQNLISLSRFSAGTSATKGCTEGLHRQFHFEDDSEDLLRAKMFRRFQRRLREGGEPLTYDPARPERVVPALLDQDSRIGVVIDGAGATWGVPSEACAQTILVRTGLMAVGFFDSFDRFRFIGDSRVPLRQRGQFYSQAQSRGADVKLSPMVLAALMAHWRNSFSEALQNEGRLRHILQPMRVVVPAGSGIKRVPQLLYQNCIVEAQEMSDDLYRNKMQEQRDIVREAILMELMTSAAALTSDKAKKIKFIERVKALKVGNYLVTENGSEWSKPGSYFKANRHIERREGDPVAMLEERRRGHREIALGLGLRSAVTELDRLTYEPLRPKLPRFVDSLKLFGKEAEVETEMEVQAEVEVAVQVEVETTVVARDERTTYLKWLCSSDKDFKIHGYLTLNPAYDVNLRFTENFLPLHRPAYAHPVHWRQPHDHRQNRLHYIKFSESSGTLIATACDLKEFSSIIGDNWHWEAGPFVVDTLFVYDTKLRHIIFVKPKNRWYGSSPKPATPPLTAIPSHLEPQMGPLVAQMRFEDGQYDTYIREELADLGRWIRRQKDPSALERYFVTEVLKNRPKDQERYRLDSPLYKLFRTIC